MDAFKQNKRLGRGVNVLGYDPIWRDRSKTRMQDKHFRLIKEAGFNSIRIALHPIRDGAMNMNNQISEEWRSVLNWAVEQSLKNSLMAILDFHEFIIMGRDFLGNREKLLSFWKQIGEIFSSCPNEVLFEFLNEPNGELTPELWNRLLTELLNIIRRSNPERTVVIGPANWNSIHSLDLLKLPRDENIIVTVHYYEPMDFTHQGAKWSGREDRVGVKWKGTVEERDAILIDFQKAQEWSKRNNRPIFLGEFGVYDKADMESRTRYLSFVARSAEENGWSWAYWQFDSDFIVYDMVNDKWVEPVLNALIPRN
ncbi:MAG: glycoside hydrolase family 5 protein [Thermoproteota archaeon]